MGLTVAQRASLEVIESSMARKSFNLADIMESLITQSIVSIESGASAGGAASEALTFTGLLATDTVLSVTQRVAGGGAGDNVIAFSTQATDALTVIWDADPGAGAIVRIAVLR